MAPQQSRQISVGLKPGSVSPLYRLQIRWLAQPLVGGPVLQNDHNAGILISRRFGVGRNEVALIHTAVVIPDAVVPFPSCPLPLVRKLK